MAALKDFQSLCSMQEFPLLGQYGLKILHRTSGVPRGKSSMQKILLQLRTFFFSWNMNSLQKEACLPKLIRHHRWKSCGQNMVPT